MAVEDHPLYEAWSKAFDSLQEARDRLKDAGTQDAALAKKDHDNALAEYQRISNQLCE